MMSNVLYTGLFVSIAAVGHLVFRIVIRRGYQNRGRLSAGQSSLELLIFLVWALFASAHLPTDWPAVHVPNLWAGLGWLCSGSGTLLIFSAIATLGLSRTFGRRSDHLVQSGPYRWTRNPQVVGLELVLLGSLLLWPSLRMAGSLILFILLGHGMIRTEEEHLTRRVPQAYRRYTARVPRYLFF